VGLFTAADAIIIDGVMCVVIDDEMVINLIVLLNSTVDSLLLAQRIGSSLSLCLFILSIIF